MPFSSLGLMPCLLRAVSEQAYSAPTEIQAAAIPALLRGEDVLAMAQTGSGKSAAFALPLLQSLLSTPRVGRPQVRALVLAPTRELAVQLAATLSGLARYSPQALKIVALTGGVAINPQMMDLRGGADIVVATPGRLLDLIDHNALHIDAVRMLVLDEADRLLDLGFADEVGRILALLPAQRQNVMLSATFAPSLQSLAETILRNPTRISVQSNPDSKPDIVQRAIVVDAGRRTQLFKYLLQENAWPQVLAFVATKYAAENVAGKLQRAGIQAAAFHGDCSQGARHAVLAQFKAGNLRVLVATDVAARGIDIAQLPVVVNFDLPRSALEYTHRIGRTGRAGASGVAISFVCADTEAHFRLIEKRHDIQLPREQIAGFEPTALPLERTGVEDDHAGHGGIKGRRKSKKDKLREAAAG